MVIQFIIIKIGVLLFLSCIIDAVRREEGN